MMRRAISIALCAGLLAACSGGDEPDPGGSPETSTEPDGGTDAAAGDGTGVSDVGGSGVDADASAGGEGCESDFDCDDAEAVCTCEGTCVVPEGEACERTKNCPFGEAWCDPCLGHCVPIVGLCQPCPNGEACGRSAACLALDGDGSKVCGRDCVGDTGCPNGYSCEPVDGVDAKQCIPDSGSCDDLGVCKKDGDCPDGEICNKELGECAEGCSDDGECPQDQICEQSRCEAACTSDEECTGEAICCQEGDEDCTQPGHCQVPGACGDALDCDPGQHCENGQCVDGCLEDAHCQDTSKRCNDEGDCVDEGCAQNYQCAFGEVCDDDGECVEAPGPHCEPCESQQGETSASECGGEPNLCLTLQDEDENEKGPFCLLTCEEGEEDRCPQGYGCEKIENEDAGIDDAYCVRQCWKDVTRAGR